jgi:hypothetical protein
MLLQAISDLREDWHRGVQAAPPSRCVHSRRVPRCATEEVLQRTASSTAGATISTSWPRLRRTRTRAQVSLGTGQHELLVRWKGMATAEMTWMPLEEFRCVYPTLQLEDELLVQWGEMSCGVYGTPDVRTSATPNREQPRTRARPTNTRHQRQMISSVSYSVKTKLVSPTFGGYKPGHQVRGGIVFYLGLACISCAPFILMRRRTALIQKFS